MSSLYRKLAKNAKNYELDNVYRNMTPEQYKEGIRLAVKNATEALAEQYDKTLKQLQDKYNENLMEGMHIAIETISIEMIYELGRRLECYNDNVEFLDQKLDIVQDIYQTAMDSIEKYTHYKTDKQAQKAFEKKRKIVQKTFGIHKD